MWARILTLSFLVTKAKRNLSSIKSWLESNWPFKRSLEMRAEG
jgi:hypothetical protein